MLVAVTSGKAAPGVTTSVWALALAWPRQVLLVDADPAGGDLASGFLAGRVTLERGLLSWASAARRASPAEAAGLLVEHSLALPESEDVWLLPGFAFAAQGASFTGEAWQRLAAALQTLALQRDVVVDTGRLTRADGRGSVLQVADRIVVGVRPTVRSVHAATSVVEEVRLVRGDLHATSVLVIGSGNYRPGEVAAALGLPLTASLPPDPRAAEVLSDGAPVSVRGLSRSALVRAAAGAARALTTEADRRPAQVGVAG